MPNYPETKSELNDSAFIFKGRGKCKDCGAIIEWWETPKGKTIPLDRMTEDHDKAIPHWKSCPEKVLL